MSVISLPTSNVDMVRPSANGTCDALIADLCGLLLREYHGSERTRPATKHDVFVLRGQLESRLREWSELLPASCTRCWNPTISGAMFCPDCEREARR